MSSLVVFTVPEETKKQINTLARQTGKPEKVVMREVFETGLKSYTLTPTKSVQAALDLIEWAEKNEIRGPKDLSTNHNKYAWEE